MNEKLQYKLESLPHVPGIYKFFDKGGSILYIGKALNINKRVNSYFKGELYDRPRIRQMMPLVDDVDVVETNNEIEALVLESAMVRQLQPPFNSDLKDDKSYAWIYISTEDEFPTVSIVRSFRKGEYKKGKLFGPYPRGLAVRRVFTYLRKIYPFCSCKGIESKSCLYYHIGLCPGVHQGAISKEDYRKNIEEIIKFLSGKQLDHIKRLKKEMDLMAKEQNFEKAAILRDRVKDLTYLGETIDFTYYDNTEDYRSKRSKARSKSFKQIALDLGVKNLSRIECYDISNIQGKHAYGSMVVAVDGELKRSDYRIFKIAGKDTPDDPGMLKEVLERRLANIKRNVDESLTTKPDIILIDGGKGQLEVVKKLIPKDIFLMGISKGKHLKRAGKQKVDEFWVVKDKGVYQVRIDTPEILIDLRNEAHRFAITHYRKRSIKESKRSVLDSIVGIGDTRRKLLIQKFKSVEGIKSASLEEIDSVIKNKKVSENIYNSFH